MEETSSFDPVAAAGEEPFGTVSRWCRERKPVLVTKATCPLESGHVNVLG